MGEAGHVDPVPVSLDLEHPIHGGGPELPGPQEGAVGGVLADEGVGLARARPVQRAVRVATDVEEPVGEGDRLRRVLAVRRGLGIDTHAELGLPDQLSIRGVPAQEGVVLAGDRLTGEGAADGPRSDHRRGGGSDILHVDDAPAREAVLPDLLPARVEPGDDPDVRRRRVLGRRLGVDVATDHGPARDRRYCLSELVVTWLTEREPEGLLQGPLADARVAGTGHQAYECHGRADQPNSRQRRATAHSSFSPTARRRSPGQTIFPMPPTTEQMPMSPTTDGQFGAPRSRERGLDPRHPGRGAVVPPVHAATRAGRGALVADEITLHNPVMHDRFVVVRGDDQRCDRKCRLTCGFAGCPRQDSNLRRTV